MEASERTQMRDDWGHQMLREGKYTPGQIDGKWTREMEAEFEQWVAKEEAPDEIEPAESRRAARVSPTRRRRAALAAFWADDVLEGRYRKRQHQLQAFRPQDHGSPGGRHRSGRP